MLFHWLNDLESKLQLSKRSGNRRLRPTRRRKVSTRPASVPVEIVEARVLLSSTNSGPPQNSYDAQYSSYAQQQQQYAAAAALKYASPSASTDVQSNDDLQSQDEITATYTAEDSSAYVPDHPESIDVDQYQADIDQTIADSSIGASPYIGAPDLDAAASGSPVSSYFDPFAEVYEYGNEETAAAYDDVSADSEQPPYSSNDPEESETNYDDAITDNLFSISPDDGDPAGETSDPLEDSPAESAEPTGDETPPNDSSSEDPDIIGGDESDEDSTLDLPTQWTPLQFPDHVTFEETTLSYADADFDWTAIQPDGVESFSHTSTSDSTVTPPTADNGNDPLAEATADLETSVTTSQTFVSPEEWTVTQSFTNRFDTSASLPNNADESTESDADDSADDANSDDLDRIGTESLTVTIVDGVSRTISYVLTDTITFESGTFSDEDENTTDEEKYSIPEDWVKQSKTSVVPTETEEFETHSTEQGSQQIPLSEASSFESWDSGVPLIDGDEQQDLAVLSDTEDTGNRYKATSSSGFTATETITTLADGTPALTYSVVFFTSSSVVSKVQGKIDLGFGLGTISENQNDGNGFKVTANANWLSFSSASIKSSFSASATVPLASGLAGLFNASIEGSFSLDVSLISGGATKSELGFQYQTSSGDSADGSDAYESFGIGGSTKATNYSDFTLGVHIPFGAAPETTNESGEESTQLTFDTADDSNDDLKVQLSTTANSSSAVSSYLNSSSKAADRSSGGHSTSESSSDSRKNKTTASNEFEIHLGTEKTGFLVGSSGKSELSVDSNSFDKAASEVGSNGLPYSTTNTITTKLKQEQDHNFKLNIGLRDEDSPEQTNDDSSSETEDQGIVIVNEGGASIDYTRTHTHSLDITTNTGTYVELTTIEGAVGDKAPADQLQADEDNTSNNDDSGDQEEADTGAGGLVKNKTLTGSGMFGDHVTVLVDNEQLPTESESDSSQNEDESVGDATSVIEFSFPSWPGGPGRHCAACHPVQPLRPYFVPEPTGPNIGMGSGNYHQTIHSLTFRVFSDETQSQLENRIYQSLRKFSHFNAGENTWATVRLDEDIALFNAIGLMGFGSDLINDDETPVQLQFNNKERLVTGITLHGHMLEGTRYWKGTVRPGLGNSYDVTLRTWALERKVGWANRFGAWMTGTEAQMEIWDQYFLNIMKQFNGIMTSPGLWHIHNDLGE